jgi:hypothetical protein
MLKNSLSFIKKIWKTKQVYEEVKMWHSFLKTINKPNNILEYLDVCDSLIFPNVYKLIKILGTLPVTTCTPFQLFVG